MLRCLSELHTRLEGSGGAAERYRRGHRGEVLAAFLLLAKGYPVIGRRVVTPTGEIDVIAVRGRRVGLVEVKRRPTMAAAEASATPRQRRRVRRAADLWLSRH